MNMEIKHNTEVENVEEEVVINIKNREKLGIEYFTAVKKIKNGELMKQISEINHK